MGSFRYYFRNDPFYKKFMKFQFLIIIYIAPIFLLGQSKHDYVWKFGYQYDTIPEMHRGVYIDFNDNVVNSYYEPTPTSILNYYAGISDSIGIFQFYTNGCYVLKSNGEIMENGDSLNPGVIWDLYCGNNEDPEYPLIDFATILPYPDHPGLYYLFHGALTKNPWPEDPDLRADKFYYSLIDMNQNDGLGKVVEKNVLLLEDRFDNSITAVKHKNNKDWWIVVSKYRNDTYFTYLLTTTGIEGPFTQEIGDSLVYNSGQSVFSPDGKKYARYNAYDDLMLFDFDRETGLLSNYQHYAIEDSAIWAVGAAFSPNSRYLYLSSTFDVYQLDTEAPDIAASRQHIAHYDGYVDFNPTAFYRMQLGPDCRIYMSATGGSYCCMHVINYPNRPGTACELVQHDIELPYPVGSFVYFPNYRLGEEEYPCDSTIVLPVTGVQELHQINNRNLKIYPNPATDELQVEIAPENMARVVEVYNMSGVKIWEGMVSENQTQVTIPVRSFVNSIYLLVIKRNGAVQSSGTFTVIR